MKSRSKKKSLAQRGMTYPDQNMKNKMLLIIFSDILAASSAQLVRLPAAGILGEELLELGKRRAVRLPVRLAVLQHFLEQRDDLASCTQCAHPRQQKLHTRARVEYFRLSSVGPVGTPRTLHSIQYKKTPRGQARRSFSAPTG